MGLRFRQDIQGLRALAVLLVALDHAAIGPFHGGFVGVDVFFVISGFLITSLLLTEADRERSVSLAGFYARRARRILPAATVVMLVTIVVGTVVLSAVEARSAIGDALWATFFVANLKFARDGTDYFNADASPSPLQHYWSLAVEEQFYVVWPLLVLGLCVLARRRAQADGARRTDRRAGSHRGPGHATEGAVPLLVTIILLSFGWSVLDSRLDTVGAYFSPFTRAWELGMGALVAVCVPLLRLQSRRVLVAASWIGLAGVLTAALLYDSTTLFPGYAAALPVLGTALLLAGGVRPVIGGPQGILSLPPLRLVGDWSYSFYLWHWPVLILAAAVWGPLGAWQGALLLLVALGLAGLTYRFVENPFRRARVISVRHARGVLLYPAVVVVTLPLLLAADRVVLAEVGGGGPAITVTDYGRSADAPAPTFSTDPVVALVEASVEAARNGVQIPADLSPSLLELDADRPSVGECEYFAINEDRPLCPRGDPEAERTLVLIGDSHARQWIPALDTLSQRYGYRAYFLVREGCPGADVTPWLANGTGPSTACAEFQDWAVEQVEELDPAVVLVGSEANQGGLADDDGELVTQTDEVAALFQQGMVRQIDRLQPLAERVVVIGDPPALEFNPGRCLSKRQASLEGCLSGEEPRSLTMIEALRQAARATGATYVETGQWFCSQGECPAVIGAYIARRDPTHVSVSYAAYLSDELEEEIGLGASPAAAD
ncbi:MAG: acyltransferase [Nocardioides sp.]|nr:acyltransferase [Nocardioides sp.]